MEGNTLASEDVLKAMAQAFEKIRREKWQTGSLPRWMPGSPRAGDSRGMQSGGLLVVQPIPSGDTTRTTDRIVDIRVDDSENPFKELRRILDVQQSGPHNTKATQLAGEGKTAEAIAELKIALQMNPKNEQINYNLAVNYAKAGDFKNSLTTLSPPQLRNSHKAEDERCG